MSRPDQNYTDLIADARVWPRDGVSKGPLINALADTIDALVKERDELAEQLKTADRQFTALKVSSGKSDARAVDLTAVVEKVRGVIGAEIGWESPAILIDRIQWALSTTPADALFMREPSDASRRHLGAWRARRTRNDELAAVIDTAKDDLDGAWVSAAGTPLGEHLLEVHRALSAAPADVLREHDRQVAERAWDEGFTRGFYAGQAYPDGTDASEPDIDNPYRKEQENGDPR